MNFITDIEIEGFRSILNAKISGLEDFSCFIGVNNSGKSNILRALNLFFTDETDTGAWFDIDSDYYNDPKRNKKKRVAITLYFNLPNNFRFRKEIKDLEKTLGRVFSIRRTWTARLDEWSYEYKKDGAGYQKIEEGKFHQFAELFRFRYIQNRIIPSETLKDEIPSFRTAIMKRYRIKRAEETDRLLSEINQAATDTIMQANKIVTDDVRSINKLTIGRTEAARLFGISGFGAEIKTGATVSDESLGAGSQAYMMFALLKIIDTNYGANFGWKQGTIWAIEEPESSLHRDLTRKLAILLRSWAEDDNLKMQIITATHSEIIATAANNGYLAELEDSLRTTVRAKSISDLINASVNLGISGNIDPILCFPTNIVVLVEGALDRRVLEYVSDKTQTACGCKFVSLRELDSEEQGDGVGNIINYLKRWGKLIPNREKNSPLIVLFDYEVDKEKLRIARSHYGTNSEYRVMKMNISHASKDVSNAIKGIERFYPKELFTKAREKDIVAISEDQHGVITIDQANQTPRVKRKLEESFYEGNISWCDNLKRVLIDVVNASVPNPQLPL